VILASSKLEIPPSQEAGGYISISPTEPKSNECPGSLHYLFLLKDAPFQTEETWNTPLLNMYTDGK